MEKKAFRNVFKQKYNVLSKGKKERIIALPLQKKARKRKAIMDAGGGGGSDGDDEPEADDEVKEHKRRT